MTGRDYSKMGDNTRLAHAGNDPHDFFGFVNPPVVHASTVLFPDAATMASRAQKYTYGTRGTPTTDALASAIDALEGSAGTIVVPSGLAAVTIPLLAFLCSGDHVLITDSVYHPTRHFADTMLKRLGVAVEYYDPLAGAGVERTAAAQHEGRAHRITRLQHFRNAGYSGDRAGSPGAWYRHDDGQHMGDPAPFPAARTWCRHFHSRGNQISRRPFRHTDRHGLGQQGALEQALRHFRRDGLLLGTRRRLPDPARPAHDGGPSGTAPGERACPRPLARTTARRRPGAASRPGEPSGTCDLEARLFRGKRHFLDRARRRRDRAGACLS